MNHVIGHVIRDMEMGPIVDIHCSRNIMQEISMIPTSTTQSLLQLLLMTQLVFIPTKIQFQTLINGFLVKVYIVYPALQWVNYCRATLSDLHDRYACQRTRNSHSTSNFIALCCSSNCGEYANISFFVGIKSTSLVANPSNEMKLKGIQQSCERIKMLMVEQ